MKSVNVLVLCSILPLSYQPRPISPPPRTCAQAHTMPRSSKLSRDTENPGSMEASYEPYPYSSAGACFSTPLRRTTETGTCSPSGAVAHTRNASYSLGS